LESCCASESTHDWCCTVYGTQGLNELEAEVQRVERIELQGRAELNELRTAGRMGCFATLWARVKIALRVFVDSPTMMLFLCLVGALSALGGAAIDALVSVFVRARDGWMGPGNDFGAFLIYVSWAVVMTLLAASVGHLISTRAEGSGIPQLKSILAGTWLHQYLSLRTMLAKTFGLIAALASGLPVGKEGPFVHVAATLTAKLWRLPCFRSIRRSETVKRQVLAAAVAAGVTATLGAPIGGMFFSVETSASYYQVSNLWRALVCSLTCVLFFEAIQTMSDDELFHPTEFLAPDLSPQLIAFALLGVLAGLLASLTVRITASAQMARRRLMRDCSQPWTRYIIVLIVSALTAAVLFGAPYLRLRDRDVINQLFQDSDGTNGQHSTDPTGAPLAPVWGSGAALFFSLGVFLLLRTFLTPIAISLPIPCGLFTPLFTLGAVLGRLFGEVIHLMDPNGNHVEPGAYAVVGAAALAAGATHTLSVAVIVFELTQQIHHMLPVLIGVVFAYLTSALFTLSIYDVLMAVNGLPFLPRLHSSNLYALRVADVMRPAPSAAPTLTRESTFIDALLLLHATRDVTDDAMAEASAAAATADSPRPVRSCCAWCNCNTELEEVARRRRLREDVIQVIQAFDLKSTPMGMPVVPGSAPRRHTLPAVSTLQSGPRPPVPEFPVVESATDLTLIGSVRRETLEKLFRSKGIGTGEGLIRRAAETGRASASLRRAEGAFSDSADPGPLASDPLLACFPVWMHQPIQYVGSDAEDASLPHTAGPSEGDTSPLVAPAASAASALPLVASGDAEVRVAAEGAMSADLVRLIIDPAPLEVQWLTPLPKAHYLLATCLFSQLLVTRHGKLVGVLYKDDLARPVRHEGSE
jgi:H+/Cl- antiporter ClcA